MTGYFEIAPARAASPTLATARFAAVLFAVAGLSHRYGLLTTPNFLLVGALVLAIALVAAALWIIAYVDVWRMGRPGAGKLALAAALLALTFAPFAFLAVNMVRYPALFDVTTDRADPPAFFALEAFPRGEGARRPGAQTPRVAAQEAAYGHVTGRRYPVSPDIVLDSVQQLLADRDWKPVHVRGRPQVDSEIDLETQAFTAFLRFPCDVAVRLTDEGDATYVDMRSVSQYGDHDLGENAERIVAFLADLDAAMLARAGR